MAFQDRPLGRQVVTVIKRIESTPDDLGVPAWVTQETDVRQCFFQPVTSEEFLTQGNDRVNTIYQVFMPTFGGPDVLPIDAVRYNGVVYEVIGDPKVWNDFNGKIHHIQLNVRRQQG